MRVSAASGDQPGRLLKWQVLWGLRTPLKNHDGGGTAQRCLVRLPTKDVLGMDPQKDQLALDHLNRITSLGLHDLCSQGLDDSPHRFEDCRKQLPTRSLGIASGMSPSWVVNRRGWLPWRASSGIKSPAVVK